MDHKVYKASGRVGFSIFFFFFFFFPFFFFICFFFSSSSFFFLPSATRIESGKVLCSRCNLISSLFCVHCQLTRCHPFHPFHPWAWNYLDLEVDIHHPFSPVSFVLFFFTQSLLPLSNIH